MKRILGLDIGTTSIGWAIVETGDTKKTNEHTGEIAQTDINNERLGIHKDAIGVRIISQDTERFDRGLTLNDPKGSTLTPAATRRKYRSSRRMNNRYKLRRQKLKKLLETLNIKPDKKYYTNQKGKRGKQNDIGKAIYELRDKAIREQISLEELGRILLHLNQWRGYSSDRFSKEEKPAFDYFIAEVVNIDLGNKTAVYDKDNKTEVKYYQIAVCLKFQEPLNLGDEENKDLKTEIDGFLFKKEIDFKKGDFITIKKPEFKQDKKGKNTLNEYYKITLTIPDPTDWNYKYQTLQKSLSDWCQNGGTVGSYFYKHFYDESVPNEKRLSRIRSNVVNREWYEQELDKIWDIQFGYHKDFLEQHKMHDLVSATFKDYQPILTQVLKKSDFKEQLKYLIKDKIIYYQRPWQQAKNKGECLFEKILIKKEVKLKGTEKKQVIDQYAGRTVIPRSHPLFQQFKIWQQINNVRLFLTTPEGKTDLFSDEKEFEKHTGKTTKEIKNLLHEALQNTKTLSWRIFVKETLGLLHLKDELDERKSQRAKVGTGVDTETGELSGTYFSVNFRKRKKDGSFEDIKLKGNTTQCEIEKALSTKPKSWFRDVYKKSSDNHYKQKEKLTEYNYKTCDYEVSNFQLLWETIYDITIPDKIIIANKIKEKFPANTFTEQELLTLSNVKFDDVGMANLSAKAIRQILPLMSNGNALTGKARKRIASLLDLNKIEQDKAPNEKLESLKSFIPDKKARLKLSKLHQESSFTYLNYWEAIAVIYGSHSTKSTARQNEIQRLKQHSMNNPVVEKIVNETISVVNEIHKTYGFDEVRIELSRELKASMEERQQMWEGMLAGATKNEWAKQMLREAKQALKEDNRNIDNLDTDTSNKSNIDKIRIVEDVVKQLKEEEYKTKTKEYKLSEPTKAEVKKYLLWLEQNFKCPYTDQLIPFTDVFARGKVVEIEHILPRERYYSNAYANKVITWREVNLLKGNRTAYEFIVSKRGTTDTVMIPGKREPVRLVNASGWEDHVKSMFPKGGKRTNLLRKEIPEDPIERTLKETQYINKKLKEKLAELVGEQKVWVTSGAVTDILRDKWHLNGIMKELMRNRFENFELPTGKKSFKLRTLKEQKAMLERIRHTLDTEEEFKLFNIPVGRKNIEIKEADELQKIGNELQQLVQENEQAGIRKIKTYEYSTSDEAFETKNLTHFTQHYNSKTGKWEDVEIFEGYSKRLDHRHHALDALIIACTKQHHIQYINTLNAINSSNVEDEKSKKSKYGFVKNDICIGDSSKKFKTPWDEKRFVPEIKNALNGLIISHKNTRFLISPSKHRVQKEIKSGKIASIRGELHKETNYARKNYFEEGSTTEIKKLIPLLFKKKQENQYQTMVHMKNFSEIIRETILKQKYQDELIPLFQKYEKDKNDKPIRLTDKLSKEFSKEVLKEIEDKKLLIDSKTGEAMNWLSTYSEKDKSSRPLGLSMDLNSEKEIKNISNPRIRKLAEYRLKYVNEQIAAIDKWDLDKKEKDKLKGKAKELKLYSNAIYEIRVKNEEDQFKWIELKHITEKDLASISYANPETTRLIKEKMSGYTLPELKQHYFEKPIFLSSKPIEVKKARQKAYFQNLYEVTPKRYVQVEETFMTYFFQEKQSENSSKEKIPKFLKFIDAVSIINTQKPDKIDYTKLIDKEKSNEEALNGTNYELLFTLAKNDLVYLPETILTEEQVKEVNWNDKKAIASYLYIVKDMNPSLNKIVFQQFYKADAIQISEPDARSIFKNPELKGQTEEIKYGTVPMLQRCIKVYSDKLGRKIVPYWEFPNGCWNSGRAKQLGLI